MRWPTVSCRRDSSRVGRTVDAGRFDALSRLWSNRSARRSLARVLAGAAIGSAVTHPLGTDVAAKRCGPCRKQKQGRCRGKKPNGTPCGGVCQECRNGACAAKANGTGCGAVCQECRDGACVTSPDNTNCDGTGRCLSGVCIDPPTCSASLVACSAGNPETCCSGICSEFNLPGGKRDLCNKGGAGKHCVQDRDCTSDACVGYRCQ